jgi:hypothetical protein
MRFLPLASHFNEVFENAFDSSAKRGRKVVVSGHARTGAELPVNIAGGEHLFFGQVEFFADASILKGCGCERVGGPSSEFFTRSAYHVLVRLDGAVSRR